MDRRESLLQGLWQQLLSVLFQTMASAGLTLLHMLSVARTLHYSVIMPIVLFTIIVELALLLVMRFGKNMPGPSPTHNSRNVCPGPL